MIHRCLPAFLIAATVLVSAPALAKDPFCVKAKEDLRGEMFTAKVPLYQTKIWPDEIRKLERDSEEIRQGAKTIVTDVGCGAKRVEVTLRPDGPGEEIEIYFFLSREDRVKPEAREHFDRMLTYVFVEAPAVEGGDSEG